jgi:hypothetical protein
MMPTPTMMPKVQEHLANGGSAMILFAPQADAMGDLMKQWGIEVHTDAVAAHEIIATGSGREGDALEQAQRFPIVFDIRDYGDHPITKPLRSLQSIHVPLMAVKPAPAGATTQPTGVKTSMLIPLPTNPKSWGETDFDALQNGDAVKFDAGRDVEGPIYGGAAAEKDKGGRLVVIGSPTFAWDRYVNDVDPEMFRRGIIVSHFPANAELFTNSVFWLAKMEPMLAISPAAMEVPRLPPIEPGAQLAWRVGLMFGLPVLVALAGVGVWFTRRD